MGRLPESWVAPHQVRRLREWVRCRHDLSRLRAGLTAEVHQTLGKEGVIPELKGIRYSGGQAWLDDVELAEAYRDRVDSLQDLMDLYSIEIATLDGRSADRLRDHRGYKAIQAIGGVGAVFVAEIGDIGRFPNPRRLCSWAGLTTRHRESDTKVQRRHITKQGSRLVRWAAIEAISGANRQPQIASVEARVGARRGVNIGRVAAARHLLTLVCYDCETARSAACNPGRPELGTARTRASKIGMTPPPHPGVVDLCEWARPGRDRTASCHPIGGDEASASSRGGGNDEFVEFFPSPDSNSSTHSS